MYIPPLMIFIFGGILVLALAGNQLFLTADVGYRTVVSTAEQMKELTYDVWKQLKVACDAESVAIEKIDEALINSIKDEKTKRFVMELSKFRAVTLDSLDKIEYLEILDELERNGKIKIDGCTIVGIVP